ncbi:MAG TPA: 30S ribosomal protein S24e [Methanomicrobiales archaeon]|nr:30S ribosomal protein S24e [Methanomicrobiales archaeon]
MDFEITSDTRNELLDRREIQFILTYTGATPSRIQVREKISATLNLNEKLVVLDSLKTEFGKMELQGMARIYGSEESMKRTEPEYLLARGTPKKAEEGA